MTPGTEPALPQEDPSKVNALKVVRLPEVNNLMGETKVEGRETGAPKDISPEGPGTKRNMK